MCDYYYPYDAVIEFGGATNYGLQYINNKTENFKENLGKNSNIEMLANDISECNLSKCDSMSGVSKCYSEVYDNNGVSLDETLHSEVSCYTTSSQESVSKVNSCSKINEITMSQNFEMEEAPRQVKNPMATDNHKQSVPKINMNTVSDFQTLGTKLNPVCPKVPSVQYHHTNPNDFRTNSIPVYDIPELNLPFSVPVSIPTPTLTSMTTPVNQINS